MQLLNEQTSPLNYLQLAITSFARCLLTNYEINLSSCASNLAVKLVTVIGCNVPWKFLHFCLKIYVYFYVEFCFRSVNALNLFTVYKYFQTI